jgi:hypothetical protein
VSSAAELRKAAATLRERALLASQGPWESDQRRMTVWADHGDCQVVRSDVDGPDADLDYIATMHPGVGLALADWLDTAGADLWAHGPLCCAEGCMKCDDDLWMPHVRCALVLARLVNCGAS